jgi:phosphate transport system substrate-binding protein
MQYRNITILLLTLCALIFASCSGRTATDGPGAAAGTGLVKVDGSSTLFPVTEAVAEEFQKSQSGKMRVTVGISGTGGGFKKFGRGEIDVVNASRPILSEEMELAKSNGVEYIELPVAFDALTVVVHPENNWVSSMTVEELKKAWEPGAQGKVMNWNQIRPEFPSDKMVLFGAGADSGTFDYFTEAIVGKAKSSRGDFTGSEDDNTLVQGIEGNKFALGYLPFAYYEPHKDRLKAISIQWDKNKVKEPVAPSMENVLAGTYNPLSRPLFIYVNVASLERPEVKAFVDFYLENAGKLATEVKYLPLPAESYAAVKERLAQRKKGTGFGGHPEVGLPIEEILKREPK